MPRGRRWEELAGSDWEEASVTLIPSADCFHGYPDYGGLTHSTMAFPGVCHTQVTGEEYTLGPTDTCPTRHTDDCII
ncbi:MAG: hypothetical protein QXQ61_03645 [Candidatus Bathyarchaeia archaeon]